MGTRIKIFVLMAAFCFEAAAAQSPLEELLKRITADNQAGDANVYSLIDVQTALGAQLSWNALLRRAVVIEPNSGMNFALVVGSPLGRCKTEIVEWAEAPTQRQGQVYVSQKLLETVFKYYPDFKFSGEEESAEVPEEAAEGGEEPDEPPEAQPPSEFKIGTILAVVMPSKAAIASGTPTSATRSHPFMAEFKKAAEAGGFTVKTAQWQAGKASKKLPSADVMLAFRIESASPPAKTAIFYYDTGKTHSTGKKNSALSEWGRISLKRKADNRAMADLLTRNLADALGPGRVLGMRGAPLEALQEQENPGILINLGISSGNAKEEARKCAELIASSLAQLQRG